MLSSESGGLGIDSWADAARSIGAIGGIVDCIAIGLVGVEAVNQGYSRSIGDEVLREVTMRLAHAVGPDGRVVRVDGVRFFATARIDAELDAAQLVALVSQPVDTRLGRIRIGGYAGSARGDSVSGRVVLELADSAMQCAQARGIGAVDCLPQVRVSTSAPHPRLSSLLLDAVARRDISVAFQPVVELATGRILEFEALARWTSSELGEVAPAVFIEAAEDAGLIHELGQIVLARSLDVVQTEVLAQRWDDRRVSVNLSAAQLSHPELASRVLEALSDRGLPGHVLQLELTETRLLADMAATAAGLVALREVGVRLAIDGFGAGGANMALLRGLPIDAIKIHSRFVADVGASRVDTAVIRSIISLARELRLDVIAEHVETPAQHVALTRMGCVGAQGFLYSRDRESTDLYQPITLPAPQPGRGFPYPQDEAGRLEALYRADVLDTPAEEVYDQIARAAAVLCGTPVSAISLIDDDRQWFKAKVGFEAEETARDVSFCSHAICSSELMEVPDALDDDRFAANPLVVGDPNMRFYAGAPLRAAAGYSYGTLCVIDTVPRALTREQRNGLTFLARQATMLLELRESMNQLSHANSQLEFAHGQRDAVEASLRQLAHYDRLTGQPNRALLMTHIDTAITASQSTGRRFAVLLCDLDDFKLVNDGLGHPAGDQLLVEVARRLQRCVRDTDTVARFGGDEFVVLLNDTDEHAAAELGARILEEMTAPISIGSSDAFRPSMSIGVAAQTIGITADDLLSNADAAMYRAKALGGGRVCHFDAALRTDAINRLTVTAEFPAAVTNGELFCLYQPEIDLGSGHLFGLEALVRWQHPTRGVLSPDQFVPILEGTNQISALFEQVLHLTLEAQVGWAAELGRWPSVAVNLSARQLNDPGLADTVRSALAQFSAPPDCLWLEVTETALASTPSFDMLHELHELGVHLAIDDFGVGWSSMARLSSFPWDLIKIDRKFIAPLGRTDKADRVVHGIIALAHSLGMQTTAEGVETVEQLQQLRDVGCDIAQGYLIDRPIPASTVLSRMTPLAGAGGAADMISYSAPSIESVHGAAVASNSAS